MQKIKHLIVSLFFSLEFISPLPVSRFICLIGFDFLLKFLNNNSKSSLRRLSEVGVGGL